MNTNNIHIMGIAETWLQASIATSEVQIPGYDFVRRDRVGRRGGGVGFYIKSGIHAKWRQDLKSHEDLEAMSVELTVNCKRYVLTCLYRPPNANVDIWDHINEFVAQSRDHCADSRKPCLVMGDFNVNVGTGSANCKRLQSLCTTYGFQVLPTGPTRISPRGESSTIDIFLGSNDLPSTSCSVLPYPISDHLPIVATLEMPEAPAAPTVAEGRNVRRINWNCFRRDLAEVINAQDYTSVPIEHAWQRWLSYIETTLDRHAPIRRFRPKVSPRNAPWVTPDFTFALEQRNRAHRRWLAAPANTQLREIFVQSRSTVKQLSRRLKAQYYERVFAQSERNARKTWQVINHLTDFLFHTVLTRKVTSADFHL